MTAHNWVRVIQGDSGYWWCEACQCSVANFAAREGSPLPTPPAKLVIAHTVLNREADADFDAHDCDAVKAWAEAFL